MFDVVRGDKALQYSRLALDGLALRQDANSDNMVNVDTPGYTAKEVNFETTLKNVMEGTPSPEVNLLRTHPNHLSIPGKSTAFTTTEDRLSTPRADGNNVDMDRELVQMNETALRQQAITQLVARKLRLLKDVTRIR